MPAALVLSGCSGNGRGDRFGGHAHRWPPDIDLRGLIVGGRGLSRCRVPPRRRRRDRPGSRGRVRWWCWRWHWCWQRSAHLRDRCGAWCGLSRGYLRSPTNSSWSDPHYRSGRRGRISGAGGIFRQMLGPCPLLRVPRHHGSPCSGRCQHGVDEVDGGVGGADSAAERRCVVDSDAVGRA